MDHPSLAFIATGVVRGFLGRRSSSRTGSSCETGSQATHLVDLRHVEHPPASPGFAGGLVEGIPRGEWFAEAFLSFWSRAPIRRCRRYQSTDARGRTIFPPGCTSLQSLPPLCQKNQRGLKGGDQERLGSGPFLLVKTSHSVFAF